MNNSTYINEALELFKQDPQVQAIIKSEAKPAIADALGMYIEDLERQILVETFANYAKSKGTDTLRLALDMVATPEEKKQVLLENNQYHAKFLDIELEEYFLLNPSLKSEIE